MLPSSPSSQFLHSVLDNVAQRPREGSQLVSEEQSSISSYCSDPSWRRSPHLMCSLIMHVTCWTLLRATKRRGVSGTVGHPSLTSCWQRWMWKARWLMKAPAEQLAPQRKDGWGTNLQKRRFHCTAPYYRRTKRWRWTDLEEWSAS